MVIGKIPNISIFPNSSGNTVFNFLIIGVLQLSIPPLKSLFERIGFILVMDNSSVVSSG